jgi:RNA polymerase sigma factor (sigma-70 family)
VPDLIDEVAHDAFVFAYRHMDDFEGGSVQAWLRAIAFNHLRDRMKAHARETVRRARYSEHLRWELAAEGMAQEPGEEAEHLNECVQSLPTNLREVIALRYEDNLTSDEIGAKLGRSAMAIRTLLVRVRHQLKHCIEAKMATV